MTVMYRYEEIHFAPPADEFGDAANARPERAS